MKNIKILYIGNNLSKKTNYKTSITILSELLENEKLSIKVISNKSNKFFRLIEMVYYTILLKNKIDYILIDTFSTLNFYYALIISQLARMFRINYIPILRGGNLPLRLKNSHYLSSLIFKHSYKNIAPSKYLLNSFKIFNYDVHYIPNTIPIKDYPFKKRNIILPKLFWVRSFKKLYNPILAIEVLVILKQKYPEAKLCMVGPFKDSSYQEALDLAKKNDVMDSIEFTNVLPKADWHKKSEDYDIFINTTNFDNTPISVIEAMALGLLIVSTNVGGMPYLIDHNKDGILVEPNNAELMAKAIISVIENNLTELSVKAREKAENFNWEVVKHLWLEILK